MYRAVYFICLWFVVLFVFSIAAISGGLSFRLIIIYARATTRFSMATKFGLFLHKIEIASFCFSMESSNFWSLVLHDPLYKTLFFDFWFSLPNAQNLLPQICTKSPISRLVWQIDRRCLDLPGGFRGWPIQWNHAKCCGPTLVAMTTKFGLGAEIQSPTGLYFLCTCRCRSYTLSESRMVSGHSPATAVRSCLSYQKCMSIRDAMRLTWVICAADVIEDWLLLTVAGVHYQSWCCGYCTLGRPRHLHLHRPRNDCRESVHYGNVASTRLSLMFVCVSSYIYQSAIYITYIRLGFFLLIELSANFFYCYALNVLKIVPIIWLLWSVWPIFAFNWKCVVCKVRSVHKFSWNF